MKNKKLIISTIFLIIIIIAIIVISCINYSNKKQSNKKEDSNTNTIIGFNSDKTVKVNNSGENTTVLIGQTNNGNDNYTYISARIDKSASEQDQAFALINAISHSIGYKIEINYIEIKSNKIKIDFSDAAAPFEIDDSYVGNGLESYSIVSENGVAKTIFDSIYKTLINYFGNDVSIYYSVNNKDISITDITPKINISSTKPYSFK